jgi:hypothetical protein
MKMLGVPINLTKSIVSRRGIGLRKAKNLEQVGNLERGEPGSRTKR